MDTGMTRNEIDASWLLERIKNLEEYFKKDSSNITDEALDNYNEYHRRLNKIRKS